MLPKIFRIFIHIIKLGFYDVCILKLGFKSIKILWLITNRFPNEFFVIPELQRNSFLTKKEKIIIEIIFLISPWKCVMVFVWNRLSEINIYCAFDIPQKDVSISYQKPFVISVPVLCFQIIIAKLILWPKVGLTCAISIVNWICF